MSKLTENDFHKWNNRFREVFIYFGLICYFPLKTIRALVWMWLFWIQKIDERIQQDHDKFNNK